MDEKPLNSESYNDITIISQDDVAEKNPTTEPGDIVQTVTKKKHRCKGYNVLDHAVKFTGGLFVFSLHLAFHDEKPFFSSYTLVENDRGCHFYTKDDNHAKVDKFNYYKSLIFKSGLDCKKYPFVYFSMSQMSPAFIVFICRKSYSEKVSAGCVTLSFSWNSI